MSPVWPTGSSADETIHGVPVTQEQIAGRAAEAEAGYDVKALKTRGRGRPGRGAEPSQVVTLRLTSAELAIIDAREARENKSRSEVIRSSGRICRVKVHQSGLKHGYTQMM